MENYIKIIIGFILLLLTSHAACEDSFVFLGSMKELNKKNETIHSNFFEVGGRVDVSAYSFVNISFMVLEHEENIYQEYQDKLHTTFSLGLNIFVGEDIRPYIGLGALLGGRKECERSNETFEESCDLNFVAGIYPEAGIQISLYDFRAGIYSRFFKTFDVSNSDEKEMLGMYVGYRIK